MDSYDMLLLVMIKQHSTVRTAQFAVTNTQDAIDDAFCSQLIMYLEFWGPARHWSSRAAPYM